MIDRKKQILYFLLNASYVGYSSKRKKLVKESRVFLTLLTSSTHNNDPYKIVRQKTILFS
jgi:hypothetical protein